jgi:lipid A oxidase
LFINKLKKVQVSLNPVLKLSKVIMRLFLAFLLAVSTASAFPAKAEQEISLYSGVQNAPDSTVKGREPNGTSFRFDAGWEGKSLSMPLYYGIRCTNWYDDNNAWSINFTHSKTYSDGKTLGRSGFSALQFTHGLNPLTVNWMHRFGSGSGFRPYVGLGAGVAIPHVEIQSPSMVKKTSEYQYGGPVIDFLGGMRYSLSSQWSLFAEYSFHYVKLDVDIDGGGNLRTNIKTNALNAGLNYAF